MAVDCESRILSPNNVAKEVADSFLDTVSVPLRRLLMNHFKSVESIQTGSFNATVLKGVPIKGDLTVAIKLVPAPAEECADYINNEVTLLKQLDHPHIITLLDSFCSTDYTVIITPMSPLGDLYTLTQNCTLTEPSARAFALQLFSALSYLHDLGIVHCNITPHTILLFPFENSSKSIKICDFSASQDLKIGKKDFPHTFSHFLAPELLLREKNFSVKIDIYASGVPLLRLLGGFDPVFPSMVAKELKPRGDLELEFPDSCFGHISEECKEFCRKCMWGVADGRLSAREALQADWLDPNFIFTANVELPQPPPVDLFFC